MLWKSGTFFVAINGGRRFAFSAASSSRSVTTDAQKSAVEKPPPKSGLVPEIPDTAPSGLQASHKKSTGGRSSFSGNIVTVFGASGIVGMNLVNRLGKEGAQIIIPYRRTGYSVKHLRPSADLGQMLFFHYHLEDEESIRKAVKHSNIVINLVGRDYETWRFKWDDVHVEGARRLARISREMGVQRFLHVSALNCSPDPPENILPGGSGFLRSKYYGELAVKEEFPKAVIIRPADIYAEHPTWYFEPFLHWGRRHHNNKIDLWQRGENTYKMPLWMGDFIDGFMRIYRDPTLDGRTYEFAGPYAYNLGEIVDWLYRKCHRGEMAWYKRLHQTGYHTWLTNVNELYTWISKRQPPWTWDMIERKECTNDVLTGPPTLEDLGITNLMVFDIRAGYLLTRYDRLAFMILERGELPEPPPLTRYPQIRKAPDEEEVELPLDEGEPAKADITSRAVVVS